MDTIEKKDIQAGDEVFVLYRNPHVPSVTNIKAAEIVQHPKNPDDVALFLHETFHVIEDDDALFSTEAAARDAYQELYEEPYEG